MISKMRCLFTATLALISGICVGTLIGIQCGKPATFDQRFHFNMTYKGDRLHFNIYGAGPPHCVVLKCMVV